MSHKWQKVLLDDIAESIDYGVTASACAEPVGPKFLRITDIQDGFVDWNSVPWCSGDTRGVQKALLETGDIVFARTGATTGKSFLIKECPKEAVFASYLIRVRLKDVADARYVAHYFRAPDYWRQITASARGAGQPGVNATSLSQLEIPLPLLGEQRRIAEILDKADALRAKRRAMLGQLDSLVDSMFDELFAVKDAPVSLSDSKLDHPKKWPFLLITDVARLATGHTPDRERPSYWNGDIPWISLTDIRDIDGTIAIKTSQQVSELGIKNSSAVKLPAGTVCFSRTASIGFVTVMGCEMATSQDFVNWVPGPKLDSTYLLWALIRSRQALRAISSGSTHKTIYVRVVERLKILLPPIELQKEFARKVEVVRALKAKAEQSLAHLDELFLSLQQRAFDGKL